MENNNNKLIPVTNSLISIEKQLTIGDKIINKKIEELFNKAFRLINSKNIDVNSNHNYLADFLKDESLLHSEKFLFLVQNKKDYEYALEIFDKIIQIDCNFKFAYYLKGIVFQKLVLVQESINSFSKALQIDNQFVSALIERIQLFEIYNSELALNDCNKLISIQPDNSEYYLTRANILFSLKEIKESINDYLISIRLDPDNIRAYNNLGRSYLYIEEVELANANCFKAIEIAEDHLVKQPNNYKMYYYIAYAEWQLEKYNKALLSINKSIEIENEFACAYDLRSRLYNIFSKYEESIDDSLKYLELNSLGFSNYNFLGLIYEKVKDYKKAEECYTKLIEMNICKCKREYKVAHRLRSWVRETLGDLKGSKEDHEICKQLKKKLI